MKLVSAHFVAPVVLAALSVLAGCSSDNPAPAGGAGSSPGGASSGGKAGSAGSNGGSVAGAGAGGSGGSVTGGAGGLGSAGSATAGAGTAGGPAASFAAVKAIISMSCYGNGCHGQEGNPLQLPSNDDTKLYTELTTHMTATCGALVNIANPAESAIVKLLKGPCNGTDRMPYMMCFEGDTDYPCVTAENIALIQAWVAQGAPKQ